MHNGIEYEFEKKLKRLAAAGGFRLVVPMLFGGDHAEKRLRRRVWGHEDPGSDEACVLSDVTRFVDYAFCGSPLRKAKGVKSKKNKENATRGIWMCWPCRKMRAVCPEGFDRRCQFIPGK